MSLLLLLCVLCTGAFVFSLLDQLAPKAMGWLMSTNRYAAGLAEEWRGKSTEELTELAQDEWQRFQDIYFWYYDTDGTDYPWAYPFRTEEEAMASIADQPDLVQAVHERDNDGVYRLYLSYHQALDDFQNEINHLDGYTAYLAEIQSRVETQSKASVFGKPGSFSQKNLAKTAEDFQAIQGVEVEFGNNRGIERWLNFKLGDYFHLTAVIVFVLAFLEERKKGLWSAIRATWGGRGRLGLTRVWILLAGSAAATVLYCVVPFLLSMALHGGWGDLTRSLQSVESFGTCPLRISILEWLFQYFAVKTLAGMLIGLFLWCVLGSITNPQFSISVLAVTLAVEYVLYAYLPVQSALNVLKYFNIFAYVHTSALYTQYLNVDFFGFPVGIRPLALWGIVIFGALFAAWALLTQSHRRPEGNRDFLGHISAPVNRALDTVRVHLTVGGWEGYKALVFQYGILLFVLVYLVCGKLTFLYSSADPADSWYTGYIADMVGPIDSSTDDYLAHARESAEHSGDAAQLLSALDRVETRVDVLRERAEKGGYEPWVINEFSYNVGYGPDSLNMQRLNGAVAVLLTALLASPLCAFERQAGVMSMLRATPRGRGWLLRRKAAMAAVLGAFVWAFVYLRELRVFLDWFTQPETFAAAVQNIDELCEFPVAISFGQYLTLLYAVRLFMLIGVAEMALTIGLFCPNVRTAYLVSAAVLGLPSLLAALGAELFKWVSPLVPVASAELMWGLGSGSFQYLLPWLAWLLAVMAALFVCYKKWVY